MLQHFDMNWTKQTSLFYFDVLLNKGLGYNCQECNGMCCEYSSDHEYYLTTFVPDIHTIKPAVVNIVTNTPTFPLIDRDSVATEIFIFALPRDAPLVEVVNGLINSLVSNNCII